MRHRGTETQRTARHVDAHAREFRSIRRALCLCVSVVSFSCVSVRVNRAHKTATRQTALSGRTVASIWLLAFAVRCLYLWQISHAPFYDLRLGDADAYDAWARRVAAGDWIGQGVFYQAPLYPYVLALLYRTLGDSVTVVRVVQALLGATSCALLAAAATFFVGETAAAIAGVLLAVYPPAIFLDGLLEIVVRHILHRGLAVAPGKAARVDDHAPVARRGRRSAC